MPPKRRRNASQPKGLSPGEQLNREAIPSISSWGWVGTHTRDPKDITLGQRIAACNLSWKKHTTCPNNYSPSKPRTVESHSSSAVTGELQDDIIVISDDEEPLCSKKGCKTNPNCLNYLGQPAWENEDGVAWDVFFKVVDLGKDPSEESREQHLPVGLKNLGATCYANASLQVWYRDLAFRSGVYRCEPPNDVTEAKYKESPIFQLQATFAALQEGNKRVFNPKRLVESLQLRTSEQQDAQEFSKLFISHLDAEFKKQTLPSLKTLITDQFQGSQVYGTICHLCKNRSERPSGFLELEISFNSNSSLEDRLEASLLPEQLSGDNKYFCSRCDALQDATRYTELRRLPPVLHFSLLRFVYDLNTMERKKSKHSISFPSVLDMHKFVGSKNDRGRLQEQSVDDDIYELRGILLHKGASAYHGHYEAQVNDVETGSWFQFNDDEVTKIDNLGDKATKKSASTAENNQNKPSSQQTRRLNARKRRRIDDSDDDITEINVVSSPQPAEKSSNIITSKDAYMLIYARKESKQSSLSLESGTAPSVPCASPKPPPQVMDVVREMNIAHDEACKAYKLKSERASTQFNELRLKVKTIYENWCATSDTDSAIVSKQALETWLSKHCVEGAIGRRDEDGSGSKTVEDAPQHTTISNSDITCQHGALDPTKSKEMKRVAIHSVDEILKETNCKFDPPLRPSDACMDCISLIFNEKLYELDHPKLVKRLEDISFCSEDQIGYWISKKWIKDWKANKPRMHKLSEPDPPPDSLEYHSHVVCEHGNLSLNSISRRKISTEAADLLRKQFPTWRPLRSDTEACSICDAQIHISKEDKRESRRQVEDEKARLNFIYESSLNSWAASNTNNISYAIIPSRFVKMWNRWVANPCANNLRPDSVDNTSLICEHQHLCIDPNCAQDMNASLTIIQQEQWDTLQNMYLAGPLISLTKRADGDGGGYQHDIPVCVDCRLKRKTEWDSTDIIIRLCGRERDKDGRSSSDPKLGVATYGRTSGARQSKRLRQNKSYGDQRTFTVTKSTTVKDLKVMASQGFSIPTISQRLFYQGKELEDNTDTASKLQLLSNDVVELREIEEVHEIHDSDSDEVRPSKRRREETGFGGTVLGNVDSSWSSSPEPIRCSSPPEIEGKPCLACTFSNDPDALLCTVCDTLF